MRERSWCRRCQPKGGEPLTVGVTSQHQVLDCSISGQAAMPAHPDLACTLDSQSAGLGQAGSVAKTELQRSKTLQQLEARPTAPCNGSRDGYQGLAPISGDPI